MTRLMRSSASPTSTPGGRRNTTMSPRPIVLASLLTSTRSRSTSVGSIDAEGMTNAWTSWDWMNQATTSAAPIASAHSTRLRVRRRRRRRLCSGVRWFPTSRWYSASISSQLRSGGFGVAFMVRTVPADVPWVGELEEGEPPERPDPHEGPTDDEVLVDRPEDAAVAGVGAVVAHDEDVALRHRDRTEAARARRDLQIGLDEESAVDVDLAVATLDGLPAEGDHTLDELLDLGGRLVRRTVEHDEVAA